MGEYCIAIVHVSIEYQTDNDHMKQTKILFFRSILHSISVVDNSSSQIEEQYLQPD